MSKVGARIYTKVSRPDPELVQALGKLPVANLDDVMNKLYAMDAEIKPINRPAICGTAITVKAICGENLMFHKAMDMAQEGDIIVVSGIGRSERSFSGEIMLQYAKARKLGGFVIDGYVRDLKGHLDADFPVYARGIQPNGPSATGAGEINVPIACGGQVVMPGDIIVGDMDGVIVIPQAEAAQILELTKAKNAFEAGVLEKYRAGNVGTGVRKWVDERVISFGCEMIED